MNLNKKDYYARYFTGTDYDIEGMSIETVGDLRSALEQILKDITIDDALEISEVTARNGKLGYILKHGVLID